MSYAFERTGNPSTNSSASFFKLSQPLRKTNHEQNKISYMGPNVSNNLPDSSKATEGLNTY